MNKTIINIFVIGIFLFGSVNAEAIIADHKAIAEFSEIPQYWLDQAKENFRIGYAHTSHGSHITSGMSDIQWDIIPGYPGTPGDYPYRYEMQTCANYDPTICEGNTCINDPNIFFQNYFYCFGDIGNYPSWINNTQNTLLSVGRNRSIIMWSLGCELSPDCRDSSVKITSIEELHSNYLDPMLNFVQQNPDVEFILQTGQLDGSGSTGQVHEFNEYIRNFAIDNHINLYDFADIERFDPDGNDYLDLGVGYQINGDGDGCRYGENGEYNWCDEWCLENSESCLGLNGCVHVSGVYAGLNCRLKGEAFWWLLARMAGWEGIPECQINSDCGINEICNNGNCEEIASYCGDGTCDDNENCVSCKQDCGKCIITPYRPYEIPIGVRFSQIKESLTFLDLFKI